MTVTSHEPDQHGPPRAVELEDSDGRLAPLPWSTREYVTRVAIRALATAWYIRTLRRPQILRLPATAGESAFDDDLAPRVVVWIDRLVCLCIFWRRARCFYRSYAIAYVMRRSGKPVLLNLGYRNLRERGSRRAHCWLTLDGQLFHESPGTAADFPVRIGGVVGQIDYYIGAETERGHEANGIPSTETAEPRAVLR